MSEEKITFANEPPITYTYENPWLGGLFLKIRNLDPNGLQKALSQQPVDWDHPKDHERLKAEGIANLVESHLFESIDLEPDEDSPDAETLADLEARALATFRILFQMGCRLGAKHDGNHPNATSEATLMDAAIARGAPISLLKRFSEEGAKKPGTAQDPTLPSSPAAMAYLGWRKALERSLDFGLDPNWRDDEGNGLLAWAMQGQKSSGIPETAKLLLSRGSDPNAFNRHGTTVLAEALLRAPPSDRPTLSKMLLNAGADPNERISGSRMIAGALAFCIDPELAIGNRFHQPMKGFFTRELAQILADAGADPNECLHGAPLIWTASRTYRPILVGIGAQIDLALGYFEHSSEAHDLRENALFTTPESIDEWMNLGASAEKLLKAMLGARERLGKRSPITESGIAHVEGKLISQSARSPETPRKSSPSL